MIIVDTHCHALAHWFEPVEMLLHQMNANGADKATLVQRSEGSSTIVTSWSACSAFRGASVRW